MAAWSEALAALVAKLGEVEEHWTAHQAAAAAAAAEVTDRLHTLGEAMVAETPSAPAPASGAPARGEVVGSSQWSTTDEPLRTYSGVPGLLDRTEE